MFDFNARPACEKIAAEIDALQERNAFLLTSAETAQAKLAEARGRLNIYLLERIVPVRHTDEYTGFVIVAATEARAREIAQGQARDETRVWVDADRTTCHIIPQGSEQVILTDYATG